VLYSYGHTDNEAHYQSWFAHTIPRDVYFAPLTWKYETYGLAYFSGAEVGSNDIKDRDDLISRAKDNRSPYWYAMAHTCWVQGVLGYMMATTLFPEYVWTIMNGREHGGYVVAKVDDDILVFDLLVDNLDDFMSLAGPAKGWVPKGDSDALYQSLIDDSMLWTPAPSMLA